MNMRQWLNMEYVTSSPGDKYVGDGSCDDDERYAQKHTKDDRQFVIVAVLIYTPKTTWEYM